MTYLTYTGFNLIKKIVRNLPIMNDNHARNQQNMLVLLTSIASVIHDYQDSTRPCSNNTLLECAFLKYQLELLAVDTKYSECDGDSCIQLIDRVKRLLELQ